jgi:hypothetical protein
MRHIATLLVVVPLLAVGCKKKEPTPAPVAAEAPSVDWHLGPATQVGHEGIGTLTIPVKVTVHGTKALLVRSWDVGVDTDGGRVCVLHSDEMKKVEAGATLEYDLRGDCAAAKLPEGDEVKLQGGIHYAFSGGDETRFDVDQKVALKR